MGIAVSSLTKSPIRQRCPVDALAEGVQEVPAVRHKVVYNTSVVAAVAAVRLAFLDPGKVVLAELAHGEASISEV